ncbi:MAG: FMN-binding protein, partial [Clostridia bacterium]|nr:FMN-binding protein [Clostridia bacterium]
MKKFFRDLVPLVGICLVAALLLAIFNLITESPIAQNALRAAQETRTRLLSTATTFEPVELEEGSAMDSCFEGFNADGESVGYVVETTVGGYGGEIVVTVGLDTENVITGINVGGDNFSETAGLGAKAKEPAFTDQFIGETVPLTLAKGTTGPRDGIIDAIAGATITSTAVNGGVNSAGKFVMDMNGDGGSPNTASVQGFAGPVAVTLSLDDAGAITEISIGDAFFNETPGFGAGALEESFQAQFIGKVPPLALSDIDAISGATITSTAVVNAINQVHAQLTGAAPVSAPVEETAPVPAAGENAKTASVRGFAGPVAVAVDLDENGAITAITIGDESFSETAGFGAKALEDSFKAQFIGKTLPLTIDDIDAIAGATITSTAVVKALNAAAGFDAEEPVEEIPPVPAASENALTASARGFASVVAVAVDLDENNTITAITIGDERFAETEGFGTKAKEDSFKAQFIGKTLPVSESDIDGIAGATFTTEAILKALNTIAESVAPVEENVPAAVVEPVAQTASAALTASAQGFAGPVAVEVTVDENNTITSIKIGDDQFAETEGFGAAALEESFQKQFIGKTLPVAADDIDGI